MNRFFVTMVGNDGVILVNRMMIDCQSTKQAVRAGKRAVMSSGIEFNSPQDIKPFLDSLSWMIETPTSSQWR